MVTKTKLKELYWKKNMTYTEIANYLGLPNGARVQHLMESYKIPRRKSIPRNQTENNNPNWNGGKKISNGYVIIRQPYHPRNVNGYVPEHILIMELQLGRFLKYYGFNDSRNEIVHHINGKKEDNRIENLQLMTFGEHIGFHNKQRDYSNIIRDNNGRFIKKIKGGGKF
jgi:hypothetical protein